MNTEIHGKTSMVSLKIVDRIVGLFVLVIILFGTYNWRQASRRAVRQNSMMGQMMGSMPGTDPIWYLFGTLIVVSILLGVYIASRDHLSEAISRQKFRSEVSTVDRNESNTSGGANEQSSGVSQEFKQEPLTTDSSRKSPSPLTFLPEDERRVIKPILESPGLTQVELRGRSGFSKAKVSQTVSELEDRGLIYREKQGRTYRVYPGELLKERQGS